MEVPLLLLVLAMILFKHCHINLAYLLLLFSILL